MEPDNSAGTLRGLYFEGFMETVTVMFQGTDHLAIFRDVKTLLDKGLEAMGHQPEWPVIPYNPALPDLSEDDLERAQDQCRIRFKLYHPRLGLLVMKVAFAHKPGTFDRFKERLGVSLDAAVSGRAR